MKVKMKVDISGTRNGKPWPPHGHTIEVTDDEARDMIAAGHAVEHDGEDEVESATVKTTPTKRGGLTKASFSGDAEPPQTAA